MKLKQKIQTFALGAVLSSALFHGVAMAETLKEANERTANTLYVAQSKQEKQAPSTVYVVQRGDTLYKIGKQFGIRYQDIQTWNNLSSSMIRVGQQLTLSGTTPVKPVAQTNAPVPMTNNREELIQLAKKLIGTPYKWGGTTLNGFDCSGFMYYTLKSQGLVSSRLNVAGYWSKVKKIASPVAGDVVFFQNTYKSGPSHMGIFLGNGQFIHAGANGVVIDSVHSSYWKKHFLGYGTFF